MLCEQLKNCPELANYDVKLAADEGDMLFEKPLCIQKGDLKQIILGERKEEDFIPVWHRT
jgi:hypothetical protein